MSRSRITPQPEPPSPVVWWHVALGLVFLLTAVAAVLFAANWIHSSQAQYQTANGKVLELRRFVDHTRDTLYGGRVYYRVEARVEYLVDGRMQDRWLRASDDLPQESLLLKLSAGPTECIVYWPPNHPEDARCSFK